MTNFPSCRQPAGVGPLNLQGKVGKTVSPSSIVLNDYNPIEYLIIVTKTRGLFLRKNLYPDKVDG